MPKGRRGITTRDGESRTVVDTSLVTSKLIVQSPHWNFRSQTRPRRSLADPRPQRLSSRPGEAPPLLESPPVSSDRTSDDERVLYVSRPSTIYEWSASNLLTYEQPTYRRNHEMTCFMKSVSINPSGIQGTDPLRTRCNRQERESSYRFKSTVH